MSGPVLASYRRLVVKVGSALLVDADGELYEAWLHALCADIAGLRAAGHEVLVVSSGSIAIGARILGVDRRRSRLEDLQAAAATGQAQLMHAYQAALAGHGLTAAQILLTPDDTEQRRRFLNARGTLNRLLSNGVVPIINENDTIATEEIRYGDNDRLAARVAQLVMADALILLSDVDGLYSADPAADSAARHIAEVARINAAITASAGETRSATGSGGMATKVQAASIATRAGCATLIASGREPHALDALANGARHTIFQTGSTPAAARKQWLAGLLEVSGRLRIDAGAVAALAAGSSLLPVGVAAVTGDFERGDVVIVEDASGTEIARGLAEYDAREAASIAGCRSEEIAAQLGYRGRSVMIHRDNLVVIDNDSD